jgi:hypothetical protein
MGDDRSSGSNAGVVIIVALLVLALPCCGGVALLGLGVFSFRAASIPAQQPVMIAPMPMDAKMAPMLPPDIAPLEPLPTELPTDAKSDFPPPDAVTPSEAFPPSK